MDKDHGYNDIGFYKSCQCHGHKSISFESHPTDFSLSCSNKLEGVSKAMLQLDECHGFPRQRLF